MKASASTLSLAAALLAALPAGAQPFDCSAPIPLSCNVTVPGSTVGGSSQVASYPCGAAATYDGPERVYSFNNPKAQVVSFLLNNAAVQLDVALINGPPAGGCDSASCLDLGDSRVIDYNLPAGSYYVVVDGKNGASGPFDLSVVCGVKVDPPTVNATLDPNDSNPANDCAHEDKTLYINPDVFQADVLFLIDTTGSQQAAIDNLKKWSQQIITRMNLNIDDVRFAVAEYKDYGDFNDNKCGYVGRNPPSPTPVPYGNPGDLPYRLVLPMTNDLAALTTALNGLSAGFGGDLPESITRALFESYSDAGIGFRATAAQVVINLTDVWPHDCDLSKCNGNSPFGIPNFGVDPGRDGTGNTADDLELMTVLNQMASRGMYLFDVYTGGVNQEAAVLDLWTCWTGVTGGQAFTSIPDLLTDVVSDTITTTIRKQVNLCSQLTLKGSSGFETWIQNLNPAARPDASLPGIYTFSLDICPPKPSTPGIYDFTVDVLCDAKKLAEELVEVTVPGGGCTPTATGQAAPVSLCAGDTVALTATGSGVPGCTVPVEYRWRGSNGFLRDWMATPAASDTPAADTSYTLDVRCTNPGCQKSSAAIPITVNPRPTADAGPDRMTCFSRPVTIGGSPTGSGGTPPLSFSWVAVPPDASMSCTSGPACASPSVNPGATTAYTVTVTDANGCAATAMATLTVNVPVTPPDEGDTVRAFKAYRDTPPDPTSLYVFWADLGGGAIEYNLRRSDNRDFSPPNGILLTVPPTFGVRIDGEVTAPPLRRFYRVSASNCAGDEGPF